MAIVLPAMIKLLRYSMVNTARQVQPDIKFLGSPSVTCQIERCLNVAAYLFRFSNGSIAAYCEFHATLKAEQSGIRLPAPRMERLRASW
jgi:hypothetical protein